MFIVNNKNYILGWIKDSLFRRWVSSTALVNLNCSISSKSRIPLYAIVGGVPSKIIGYRFPHEVIDRLLELRFWERSEEEIKRIIDLFKLENLQVEDNDRWVSI